MDLRGGVKVPTGGNGNGVFPEIEPASGSRLDWQRYLTMAELVRWKQDSGVIPEPTVIVRMVEDQTAVEQMAPLGGLVLGEDHA